MAAAVDALLFDMDGVLVNTEPLKGLAHAFTVGALGGTASADWYRSLMGQSHKPVIEEFMRRAGVDASDDEYDAIYYARYGELLRERVMLADGVRRLHEDLVDAGIAAALVSSSDRWMIDEIVDRLELGDWFVTTVSANDVKRPKPDPEPYLLALKRMDAHAARTIVLEDSASGVTAAVAAGCRVFAIRHELNAEHDLSAALAAFDRIPRLAGILAYLDPG